MSVVTVITVRHINPKVARRSQRPYSWMLLPGRKLLSHGSSLTNCIQTCLHKLSRPAQKFLDHLTRQLLGLLNSGAFQPWGCFNAPRMLVAPCRLRCSIGWNLRCEVNNRGHG